MPSWSIHLKIGKELLKRYNYNKDKFLFGSLIPDTDYSWKYNRFIAHYYGNIKFTECQSEFKADIESFKKGYLKVLDDDLIKGYYVHLLADNYYNKYIYYNKWIQNDNRVIGVKTIKGNRICDYRTIVRYKHEDLALYGKKLFAKEELLLPNDGTNVIDSINNLKDGYITKENVFKRINYLHNKYLNEFIKMDKEEEEKDYTLFTQKELDDLLNSCIRYIISKIDELSN